MLTYDVALWLSWPSLFPEYVENVQAFDHFTAVQAAMQHVKVSSVCRAAAACAGSLRRYFDVVLEQEEVLQ